MTITISKETTGIVGPVLGNGLPDYAGALNVRYGKGVTPENNGFVLWYAVLSPGWSVAADPYSARGQATFLKELGIEEPPAGRALWQDYMDRHWNDKRPKSGDDYYMELLKAGHTLWTAKDYPDIAAYLEEMKPVIEQTARAAARDRWWCPAIQEEDGTLFLTYYPAFSGIRRAGDGIRARATLRAAAGDFDGFVADVITVQRLARHNARGPSALQRLIAHSMINEVDNTAGAVVGSGRLTAAQCDVLLKALDGLPALEGFSECVDIGERWNQLQRALMIARSHGFIPEPVQGMFSGADLGRIDPHLRWQFSTLEPGAVDWDIVLKRLNEQTDAVLAAVSKTDYGELVKASEGLKKKVNDSIDAFTTQENLRKRTDQTTAEYSELVAKTLIGFMTPPLSMAEASIRRSDMKEQMLRVLIAAAKFKAEKGTWPARLEELVPEHLRELPRDLCAPGGTFRYRVNERGALVYSVGPNGKDEGGKAGGLEKADDPHVGAE
jgi:hypothetical protein